MVSFLLLFIYIEGLIWWLVVKNLPVKGGGMGSISGQGRSPEGGNGNQLQCSCLESPMDRGAWRLQSMMSQSQTQLSNQVHIYFFPKYSWYIMLYVIAVSEWVSEWKSLSCVRLFVIPWTIQSMEFSRPDYWSR